MRGGVRGAPGRGWDHYSGAGVQTGPAERNHYGTTISF